MNTAFYLFRLHGIRPSEYQSMGRGEKIVIRAFLDTEIEQINKEREVKDGW